MADGRLCLREEGAQFCFTMTNDLHFAVQRYRSSVGTGFAYESSYSGRSTYSYAAGTDTPKALNGDESGLVCPPFNTRGGPKYV